MFVYGKLGRFEIEWVVSDSELLVLVLSFKVGEEVVEAKLGGVVSPSKYTSV